MVINIVSGSPNLNIELIRNHKADYCIGVDYGAYQLVKNDFKIDLAVGDFDSIDKDNLELIKDHCEQVIIYPSEKAETDTEIALEAAFMLHPSEINLFGATGKRLDHFLGAFYLFKQTLARNIRLNIIDDNNCLYVLKPGIHQINKNNYKYKSLFAFSEYVSNITLTNFKYQLNNHLLKNENSLCLSNEVVSDKGIISFDEGILLIVESYD